MHTAKPQADKFSFLFSLALRFSKDIFSSERRVRGHCKQDWQEFLNRLCSRRLVYPDLSFYHLRHLRLCQEARYGLDLAMMAKDSGPVSSDAAAIPDAAIGQHRQAWRFVLTATNYAIGRLRAVTSISIFMRGSARPAEIIIAAGRTEPKYLRRTGQHCSNSPPSGRTYVTRTTS